MTIDGTATVIATAGVEMAPGTAAEVGARVAIETRTTGTETHTDAGIVR